MLAQTAPAGEIIGHPGGGEWVYGYRLRLTLCDDHPTILGTKSQHNDRGPESLGVMLSLLAGHDLSHFDQIARTIRAAREQD